MRVENPSILSMVIEEGQGVDKLRAVQQYRVFIQYRELI